MSQDLFKDRVAVLATMHQKEKVMAPILEELGLQVVVPPNLDTDIFGTFSGEIQRQGNQLNAARLKAQNALEATGATIAIASEGTFGPHPNIPWVPYNQELVIFIDKEQELEVTGREVSIHTNHKQKVISNLEEGLEFAQQIGFPEHGLIVMDTDCATKKQIVKGITEEVVLRTAINEALERSPNKQAVIQTDMRAMYNPTRMKNIQKATLDLVKNLKQLCPQCSMPGFQVSQAIAGLNCAYCHQPTALTKSLIYKCHKCAFVQEEKFPDGHQYADPAQCCYCNP